MLEYWTPRQIVEQLNKPLLGVSPWQADNLTFSFSNTVSPDAVGMLESASFSPFNAVQRTAARLVFSAFSDVIDVQFTEVSGQQGNAGDFRFANYIGGQNTAFANYPGSGLGGDMFFSIAAVPADQPDLAHPVRGNHAFFTFLHELGHAMGLGHPGNYDGGSPTYAADALFAQDTEQFTVMSYFQAQDADNGNDHVDPSGLRHFAQTLMLYDIAALQATYGANLTTRSGATVYGFNSSMAVDSPYNFAENKYPVVCIFDAGGRDRIDFSGFTGPTRINLAPGSFSDSEDMAQNISIAFGTVIENATGGSSADDIMGNRAGNILRGLAGRDSLVGKAGDDQLAGGGDNDTLNGGLGDDTLTGGVGGDFMKGGAGTDIFDFDTTAESGGAKSTTDIIRDFAVGGDMIDVSDIDANISMGGNQVFIFINNATFSKSAGELRAVVGRVEADIDGDGLADLRIIMSNGTDLRFGDFIL